MGLKLYFGREYCGITSVCQIRLDILDYYYICFDASRVSNPIDSRQQRLKHREDSSPCGLLRSESMHSHWQAQSRSIVTLHVGRTLITFELELTLSEKSVFRPGHISEAVGFTFSSSSANRL